VVATAAARWQQINRVVRVSLVDMIHKPTTVAFGDSMNLSPRVLNEHAIASHENKSLLTILPLTKPPLAADHFMVTRFRINRVSKVTLAVLTLATALTKLGCVSEAPAPTTEQALSIVTEPYQQIDVEMMASDYRLYFRYPGQDRVSGTNDDRFGKQHLFVPAGSQVHLLLKSRDFVYTVEIPHAKVYEIAAPELVFEVDFTAPQATGTFDLRSSQMCGYNHPELLGTMIVQTDHEFHRTMQSLSTTPPPPVQ
tara:strand:- start:7723 stop:8481 length:759 start_codon:yes stop_codon:yes gene_type:complete